MKKIISLILCLLLSLSTLGPAWAEEPETDEAGGAAEAAEVSDAAVRTDYVFRVASSGKVLTAMADGSSLTMADYTPASRSQLWRIEDGVIYSRLNNRAITAEGGVSLAPNKGLDTQKCTVGEDGLVTFASGRLTVNDNDELVLTQDGTSWEVTTPEALAGASASGESYEEVTVGGTMVLLLEGTTTVLTLGEDNISLTTAPYEMGAGNQFWNFTKNGAAFNISSTKTATYVDVSGSSLSPGGQLILWRGTGGDNQKWEVEQENGFCYIKSVLSGLYMTASNGALTQQTKEGCSAWRLMSMDEINYAFLYGSGNSAAFEKNARLLKNLGIADSAREYAENDLVTNRDAVTMAVGLIDGGEDCAPGTTDYADVDASDALSGYVNRAGELGMLGGRTMFYPDYAARADETLDMLVRGLGLGGLAAVYGGTVPYAVGSGLLKGVTAFEDNAITYGQFFKLLVNALSVELPAEAYTSSGVLYSMKDSNRLVDRYWDLTVLRKAEITDSNAGDAGFTAVCDGESYSLVIPDIYRGVELKGLTADIWLYGDETVLNIDIYSSATVVYGYITSVNGVDDSTAEFDPRLVQTFNVNYKSARYRPAADTVLTVDGSDAFAGVRLVGCYVRAVTRNGRVSYMDVYNMTEGGLFRETDGETLTFLRGSRPRAQIRGLTGKNRVDVVLNGRPSSLEAIPYNAVIDYCETEDMLFVAATVDIAAGEFESMNGGVFTIDGAAYETENVFGRVYYSYDMGETYDEDPSGRGGYLNSDVTAYLDVSGGIRYIRGDKGGDSVLGVITRLDANRFGDSVRVTHLSVYSDYGGSMSSRTFELDLSGRSELTKDDLAELYKSSDNVDDWLYEFRIADGKIKRISRLDWLECSDNAKNNVSSQVRGDLVDTYGEERVNELFADPNVFITGWTMGRDYGLARINFQARTAAGDDYNFMCGGYAPRYIMAYDSDDEFRPRQIGWEDYRNTNFDRTFLKVGFLKENLEHIYPDVVYILSNGHGAAVSSWDVHGVVKNIYGDIDENGDDYYTIELMEPGGVTGTYTVESADDMTGYLDGSTPTRGSAVTLSVHGTYEKVYYNIYGEILSEEEAWELEDAGDYVETREEYQSNGYASVAKVWDMPNEIGRFNNEYSVTYVSNIYKIDGNLMYYRDSASGAIQPCSATSGQLFIMEDASHYLMFDYEDFKEGRINDPMTLDEIATEAYGGESDKLLIFSVSRGRYPKIILRMPADWEP